MSDAQLARYAELIYARTGIRVSPQKKALLSNRLRRRLRSTGIQGFEEYYQHLKRLPPQRRRVGRLPPGDHHARDLPVPRSGPVGLVPQRLSSRACGGAPAEGSPACGSGRRRAAPATRRSPRPAASPPACPTSAEWKIQILGTDIGEGRHRAGQDRRLRRAGHAAGARMPTGDAFSPRQRTPTSGRPSRS